MRTKRNNNPVLNRKSAAFTRDGRRVENLTFVEELQSYVGYVNGEAYVWSKDGRHSKKNKSKNDLVQENNVYVNLRNWNGRITVSSYNTREEALKNTGRGYIKTVDISIDAIA